MPPTRFPVIFSREFDGVTEKVAIKEGDDFVTQNPNGPFEVLWSVPNTPLETEHIAIVRFVGADDQIFVYQNLGSGTSLNGGPLVPEGNSFLTGLGANDNLALKVPTEDNAPIVFVNVGGINPASETGAVVLPTSPFFGQVEEILDVDDTVGTESGNPLFVKGKIGFNVLAYLGQNGASEHWALLAKAITAEGGELRWIEYNP